MSTMEQWNGKALAPVPATCCASCMFNTISCGTITMCPSSIGGKFVIDDDGILKGVENYYCFCLKPSPIPCCMCCGFEGTPCAAMPKFKKESDTKWVGTGESQVAGGCCTAMMHNKGDSLEIVPGDKPMINWAAGTSPFYPPCMHNKVNVKMYMAGGSPAVSEMER